MPIVIRRATRADVPALGRLGALLVRTHHAFDAERFFDASPGTEQGYGGAGVGRMLLRHILAFLKSRDVPRVVLSTAVNNEPAQRLFEQAGFRRTMIEMTAEARDLPTETFPD
jgi:ribosomal protein S18 acetylase RimI-like enzyme